MALASDALDQELFAANGKLEAAYAELQKVRGEWLRARHLYPGNAQANELGQRYAEIVRAQWDAHYREITRLDGEFQAALSGLAT